MKNPSPLISKQPLSGNPKSAAAGLAILDKTGFGDHFTDHMVSIDYTENAGRRTAAVSAPAHQGWGWTTD